MVIKAAQYAATHRYFGQMLLLMVLTDILSPTLSALLFPNLSAILSLIALSLATSGVAPR